MLINVAVRRLQRNKHVRSRVDGNRVHPYALSTTSGRIRWRTGRSLMTWRHASYANRVSDALRYYTALSAPDGGSAYLTDGGTTSHGGGA